VNEPQILLVTVCIRGRLPILANDAVHDTLRDTWSAESDWVVGNYVVMPDHLHLFCAPGAQCARSVKLWCARWKSCVSRRAPEVRGRWVPDCWDTQMRSHEHYLRKLAYVQDNPVRKGLAQRPEDWPLRGNLADLAWIL